MNRKKKLENKFNKRLKRARAKLDTRPKGKRYISKADRAKAEAEALVTAEKTLNENEVEKSESGEVNSEWKGCDIYPEKLINFK